MGCNDCEACSSPDFKNRPIPSTHEDEITLDGELREQMQDEINALKHVPLTDLTGKIARRSSAQQGDSAVLIRPAKRHTSSIFLRGKLGRKRAQPKPPGVLIEPQAQRFRLPLLLAAGATLALVIATAIVLNNGINGDRTVETQKPPNVSGPGAIP